MEAPLLNDGIVGGVVDFKGRPAHRTKSGCWKSAAFILVVEMAERFAYFGIRSNLMSYLTGPMGQSTAAAAANVNAWIGATMLLPLLGAFIADSFLGLYRTITIASVLYVLGYGFLSVSAGLHSSKCGSDADNFACSPPLSEFIAFFISLYLVSFAIGGHRPCLQAFGADQFDEEDEKECKAKSSFFNWWHFSMHGGVLIAILVLSYIQDNLSWALGFGIPGIVMCFALILFLLGSRTYRFRISIGERNPFVRIGLVFVKAITSWLANPTTAVCIEEEAERNLPRRHDEFTFLDKAIHAPNDSKQDNYVCSKSDVQDAKAILRLFPIWSACLIFTLVYSQASTLFIKQGAMMDRYVTHGFQISAAWLQSIMSLSIIFCMPIYDRILVPVTRALTKKPSGISMPQRIGTGLFFSLLAIVTAAFVERKRLSIAVKSGLVDNPEVTVPMSVWWLAPQYLLIGIGEIFTLVGLQEFFYDQVPSELKSIGLALYLSVHGIGSFLSSFVIFVVEKVTNGDGHGGSWFSNNLNQAHLDYFYWLLAGLNAVSMVAYVYLAKAYVYKRKGNVLY